MKDSSDSREGVSDQIISDRMGVLPSFFDQTSTIREMLWGQACNGYLDNPMPPLFKERLFVYTSRFSRSSYCVTRHAAFLLGYGNIAGDPDCQPLPAIEVIDLLDRPPPSLKTASAFFAAETSHPDKCQAASV